MKKGIFSVMRALIVLIGVCVSGYFIRIINDLNMVPPKYYWVLAILLFILNILGIIGLFGKKIWSKIVSGIIYVILVSVSLIGINYGNDTINFLNNSFNNNNLEVTGYNVIVLKDSEYEKLSDLNGKSMGYLSIDSQEEAYKSVLKGKVNSDLIDYNDVYKLYNDLLDKKIESIILDEAYLDILEEVYDDINDKIKVLDRFEIETKINKSEKNVKKLEPINIYVSGSDSRSGKITNKSRSDVNMIITINPNTKKILLTSIPRDYYVQLHGKVGSKDKLTHAGIYGIDVSKTTIEDVLGIKIDYTIKVGFRSVVQLVDLIGGIDIDSDAAFTSHCVDGGAVKTDVKKGMNHFNGAQALSYARERYAYKEGDRHRIQNQQQVLEAIMTKIMNNKSLLLKYESFLSSFSELYRTDIPDNIIRLFVKNQLNEMKSWSIEKQWVNGSNARKQTYSMPGRSLYVMIPDESSLNGATAKINNVLNGD